MFNRLQAKLPPDEEVLAAVALMRGPRPGSEVYWPIAGVLADLWIGLLVALGVSKVRRYYVLAATADRAILFRASWIGRPTDVEEVVDFSRIGEINDAVGDAFIEVGAHRYWISGFGDQVYRLRRVMAAHAMRPRNDC